MDGFKLKVITPYKVIFDGIATKVISRDRDGEFSINLDSQNLLTTIIPTKLTIVDENNKELEYFASGGVIKVLHNEVSLCLDSAETREEIDLKRAEHSKERAEKRIAEHKEAELENLRNKLALERAISRINFYNNK
ncbi:MAG: ATP synthase F1 subunit epsilon [Sarcina sp.]